ncbi:MAG: SixA phosphatase family protein [Acidimicrobiia bacterium]
MKALLLLRHGKSNWAEDTGDDRSRPLAKGGERAARLMGELLANAGQVPDRAVTSPAARARTTLALAMEAGGWQCPTEVNVDDWAQVGPGGGELIFLLPPRMVDDD